MTARWFVNSRGQLVAHDYVWRPVGKHDPAEPQEIIDRGYQGRGLLALVDAERPGLVLIGDQRGQLALLVTGLIPRGDPADSGRRPIRATLLGVADRADAPACRALAAVAAEALRGNLGSEIPIRYAADAGDKGFDVDADRWSGYVGQLVRELPEVKPAEPARARLVPDDDAFRGQVADEVASADLLALAGRIVVLRTSILDEAEIGRLYPWRALSPVVPDPRTLTRQPLLGSPGSISELLDRGGDLVQKAGHALSELEQFVKSRSLRNGAVVLLIVAIGVALGIIRPWRHPESPRHRPTPPVAAPVLLTWGDGGGGAIATTTRVDVHWPGRSKLVEAVAGQDFSLVRTSAGQVLAWGQNSSGELGNGGTNSSAQPVPVDLPPAMRQISAGCLHSLALAADGRVMAWGDNNDGQLGVPVKNVPFSSSPVTVPLPGGAPAEQVSAGCADSLALTRAGQVLAWGSSAYGQLGFKSNHAVSGPQAVRLPGGVHVVQVSAGCGFSLALTADGTVYAWGNDSIGQLGRKLGSHLRAPILSDGTPVKVPGTGPGGADVMQISAGCTHSLALTRTGAILAWGDDSYGELGNGTATGPGHQVTQVKLRPGTTVIEVIAGYRYSLALTSKHRVLAWGDNSHGQLDGAASASDSLRPVLAPIENGQYAITAIGTGAGASHSVAIGQVTLLTR